MAERSKMMDKLYGEDSAKTIYDGLEYLDHTLNDEVQRIVYDNYWAKPGLTMREKCLVTITSLMIRSLEEQTRIHFNAFLNSDGTSDEAVALLIHLVEKVGEASAGKGHIALSEVLREKNMDDNFIEEIAQKFKNKTAHPKYHPLKRHDLQLVEIAACVAVGNTDAIDASFIGYLNTNQGNYEKIRFLLLHQIIYCGFPTAVNGFTRLRKVLEDRISYELY